MEATQIALYRRGDWRAHDRGRRIYLCQFTGHVARSGFGIPEHGHEIKRPDHEFLSQRPV